MVHGALSTKTQNYLSELIRRKAISEESLLDQMFIHYLHSLRIDEDYLYLNFAGYKEV
ncbi:MAG: hypothetical protein N2484_04905 [Clostridia bacterium]|nr:hypothetical protein [Clostridia bacterium]